MDRIERKNVVYFIFIDSKLFQSDSVIQITSAYRQSLIDHVRINIAVFPLSSLEIFTLLLKTGRGGGLGETTFSNAAKSHTYQSSFLGSWIVIIALPMLRKTGGFVTTN